MEEKPNPEAGPPGPVEGVRLCRYGLLSASGPDARAFLHAQLTNDIQHLPSERAALAGWCSPKGRLLASFLVVSRENAFLLQLAGDLAPLAAKRLSMFVFRSKVKIADESEAWQQLGLWGDAAAARLRSAGLQVPEDAFGVAAHEELIAIRFSADRFLLLGSEAPLQALGRELAFSPAAEEAWALREIRAGRPFISAATQDQFVPQMVNLEQLGGVDFQKGCYPGQEIVARTQYRGQLKRRMVRARLPAGTDVRPGQDLFADHLPGQPAGMVVDAAGGELLAVLPLGFSGGSVFRLSPGGPVLEIATA
jgi:tRNA-modifying protein YgfZ